MGKPLRVLFVENSEDDMELSLRELRRHGYDPVYKRVETKETLSAALEDEAWDAIISDYNMPKLSAPDALALLQGKGLDLPFIVVSGTITEERAVTVLKAGAHDFVAKERLTRLVPAIERELREVVVRRERGAAQKALTEKVKELELLNRVMMNREERILELKEEIKRLQTHIPIKNQGGI